MFWWGIFISCSQSFKRDAGHDYLYFTILSPLFITALLFGLSGMPILERNANKRFRKDPKYLEYRGETSVLIPLPPWLYRALPMIVKRVFLFEFQMYALGLEEEGDGDTLRNALRDKEVNSNTGKVCSQ